MHIATISSQRQITLPKAMLDKLSLSVKDKVKVEVANNKLVMESINMKIADLAGCLLPYIHPSKLGVPYEEAKRIAMKRLLKKAINEQNLPD